MPVSNFRAVDYSIYPDPAETVQDATLAGVDALTATALSAGGSLILRAGHGDQETPGSYASGNVVLRTFSTAADAALNVTATEGFLKIPAGERALSADVTNATTTMGNLTGLTINLRAGRTYSFRAVLFAVDSVAGEGLKFDLDGGTATATDLEAFATLVSTAGTAFVAALTLTALATDFAMATVTGVSKVEIEGVITVNAGGTFIPRFAQNSHSSGTATVNRGSYIVVKDIG
jgi:hypothetical protein